VILTQLWLPLQVPPFFSPLVLVCVVFLLLVCRLVHRMTLKNSFAADIEKENGSVEMGHIPSLKAGWNGTGLLSPSSKLSPSSSGRMNFQISKTLSNTGESNTTGVASQTASGVLSASGFPSVRPGSTTSSGLLLHMQSALNPDEAREYVIKVADLLLEFSCADTIVKSHMCSLSLLIRLFQMLNKLEAPILVKVW
jgi:hypothetical protein